MKYFLFLFSNNPKWTTVNLIKHSKKKKSKKQFWIEIKNYLET